MATALPIPQIAGYSFDVAADLSDPATRKRLTPAAIKAFLSILEKWGVKDDDARHLLGGGGFSSEVFGVHHARTPHII